MSVLSPELRRRIVRHHHTTTRQELLDDGVAARDVDTWLATRVLAEIEPGVYALADALLTAPFTTRAAARCRRDDQVCDALTSAQIWGLPGVFSVRRPTTIAAGTLPRSLVVTRRDGIRVLSRGATWFGLAEMMRPAAFERWTQETIGHHVKVADAHRSVRLLADPRRAPHRRAATVLSATRRWQRPADSDLERRVRSSMRRRGVTGLDGAHRILVAGEFVVHPTVVCHAARWGIEIDHRTWHGGRHGDAMRRWIDRGLQQRGWTIETVTDRQLRRDFAATMAELADRRAELVRRAAS